MTEGATDLFAWSEDARGRTETGHDALTRPEDRAVADEAAILEEELVYGALRREHLWQRLGLTGLIFGALGCLAAAAVSVLDVDPPPVVVPYDPETGVALPEASVGATTVTENRAVIEAEVFRYVTDREVYNQLDNDLRIRSVLGRSDRAAEASLRQLWTSASPTTPRRSMGRTRASRSRCSASAGSARAARRSGSGNA